MKTPWASRRSMPVMYRVVNFFVWLVLRVFYRLRVYGQEHFFEGAAIIAANHISFLDPPILGVSWPEEVHFLAKQSLFKIPVFGWIITKINTHPLKGDGGDLAVVKAICQLLNEGKKVVLFPEGKRSYDNQLSPIKPGISLLLSKTHAAIIPTYIFGTFEAWPRTQWLPKPWKKIGCVFGTPFSWKDFMYLEKKEAQNALAERLTKAIEGLKEWYEQGATGSPP
jgi:1-acyl-sn-glycerol-3-phosphate acyltransferase